MAIAHFMLTLILTILAIHTPLTLSAKAAAWSTETKLLAGTAGISTAAAFILMAMPQTGNKIRAFFLNPSAYIDHMKKRGATKLEIGTFVGMATAVATAVAAGVMAYKTSASTTTPSGDEKIPTDEPEMPQKQVVPALTITEKPEPLKTPPVIIPSDLSKDNAHSADESDEAEMILRSEHHKQLRKDGKTPQMLAIIAAEKAIPTISADLQELHSLLKKTRAEAERINFNDPMRSVLEERISSMTTELAERTEALAKQQDILNQLRGMHAPEGPAPAIANDTPPTRPTETPKATATDHDASPSTDSSATPLRKPEASSTTPKTPYFLNANLKNWCAKMERAKTLSMLKTAQGSALATISQLASIEAITETDKEKKIQEVTAIHNKRQAELVLIAKQDREKEQLRREKLRVQKEAGLLSPPPPPTFAQPTTPILPPPPPAFPQPTTPVIPAAAPLARKHRSS